MSDLYSRQQLVRRGWAKGLLAQTEPDEVVKTSWGRTVYFYESQRVHRLEATPQIARRIALAWRMRRDHAASKFAHYTAIARGA
jgi:hypothetical protein